MADKKNTSGKAETLLVELLTEELPPKSLKALEESFRESLAEDLESYGFLTEKSNACCFATPRRLAVSISHVLPKAPDLHERVTGPSAMAPINAVAGFARKHGVDVEQLTQVDTQKGKAYAVERTVSGFRIDDFLGPRIEAALKSLPIAKVMRWGGGDAQFVRPVHGLIMMHGARVVPGEVLGLKSGNQTSGHRFLSSGRITIKHAEDYEQALLKSKVVANYKVRLSEIINNINELCDNKMVPVANDALYDEIAALVEAPTVYEGKFSSEFLVVPQECLILSMQQHQKYIPLRDKATGKLLPRFLFVSNLDAKDPRGIIHGNERVLQARLADAKFFFEQDKKVNLPERLPALRRVVYQTKLGTQFERVERIKNLAVGVGRLLNLTEQELYSLERAAYWCKCDLVTEMVGEFPELQGFMGKYYLVDTDKSWDVPKIAQAIEEHYRPRFSGDALPESKIGICAALADKLDVLVGIFGIGLLPTGEKDPFALRRHALGVVRILCEHKLPLDLDQLLKTAHNNFPQGLLIASHNHDGVSVPNYVEVEFFVAERAKSYLRDLGYTVLEVESVLDLRPRPSQFIGRLNAVREFLKLPEAVGLAEADKRIRNILSKSPGGASIVRLTEEPLLCEDAEKQLLRITRLLRKQVDVLLESDKFSDALLLTAQVHLPVSRFFDQVMVNVDDITIRNNRFALLHEVSNLTNRVAHIFKLAA